LQIFSEPLPRSAIGIVSFTAPELFLHKQELSPLNLQKRVDVYINSTLANDVAAP